MQEENTPSVSLYLGPWAFYQLPIKGMLGEVCGCMQHNFHLPRVEALAAQESEVPSAQRTCRQEPGELLVTALQFTTIISKDPYTIHIPNI